MNPLNISPAFLTDLQKVINQYGYSLQAANLNPKQGNSRYVFSDGTIKLLVEFSKDIK